MKMQVWYKEATSDAEANPTLTEGTRTWNVAGAVVQVFSKAADEVWEVPVVVYGADEVTGTPISITFGSDPGVTANDLIVTAWRALRLTAPGGIPRTWSPQSNSGMLNCTSNSAWPGNQIPGCT